MDRGKYQKSRPFKLNSKTALISILLVAIAGANLYQAYKVSPERYAATQSTATMFLAVTENIEKAQPDRPKNIAVILKDTWGFDMMRIFQDVYPYLDWFHLSPIIVNEPVLPADRMSLFSDPDTIIMIPPYLEPEWQNALGAPLTALGKNRCDIWIPDTRKYLVVFYPPDLPSEICLFDTGLALDAKAAGAVP